MANIGKKIKETQKVAQKVASQSVSESDELAVWQDYNSSDHWREVLQANGWTPKDSDSDHEFWELDNEAGSANWNFEERLFHSLAVSGGLEERTYTPSELYIIYEDDGDKSKSYSRLSAVGYGAEARKVTEAKKTEINPKFQSLSDPDTLIGHIDELKTNGVSKGKVLDHEAILDELLEQFIPLDFKALAFGGVVKLKAELEKLKSDSEEAKQIIKKLESYKLKVKHFLVLSIENILSMAMVNDWAICKNHDSIYLYNGCYWSIIDKDGFQKFIGQACEKMGVQRFDARHYVFREMGYKQFLSTAYLPSPEPKKSEVLINLKNGTFEITPKKIHLRDFDRSDFITYQLPFNYTPEAKAPIFQNYLDTVLPDKSRQMVLSEYIGALFIRNGSDSIKEEKALILLGGGSNGKSVFFEVISALLGSDNVCNYSLQSLTNESGYYRAKLGDKLVNYSSEINGKLEASIFKQMTSGEPLEARLPYGQPFILKQYAKLIFNCNELPSDIEQTNAFFRRFLIIPFDVTIPPEKQDKRLHAKIIQAELGGVFNWVLFGLKRLLVQKEFTACQAAQDATSSYRLKSDSVAMFTVDGYTRSDTAYIRVKELYRAYKNYCVEDGYYPVKKPNFIRRLKSNNVHVKRLNIGNVAYLSDNYDPLA